MCVGHGSNPHLLMGASMLTATPPRLPVATTVSKPTSISGCLSERSEQTTALTPTLNETPFKLFMSISYLNILIKHPHTMFSYTYDYTRMVHYITLSFYKIQIMSISVVDVKKVGNIVPRAGFEPIRFAIHGISC